LLAKVIARGAQREEAIDRLSAALQEFAADGIKTTARLCARIVSGDRFRRGDIGPDIIDQYVNGSG